MGTSSALGQPIGTLGYQGRVRINGGAYTGTGQFKFAVVNGDGSSVYWSNATSTNSEGQASAAVSLPVVHGLFSAILGETNMANMGALPVSLFTNKVSTLVGDALYLRVWFNDGINGFQRLTPDQRLSGVGFALAANYARSADTLSGPLEVSSLPADVALKSTDLAGLISSFSNQLASLRSDLWITSNHLANFIRPGSTLASSDPADPQFQAAGYVPFYQLSIPDWKDGVTVSQPSARSECAAAWTGDSFLIWGGGIGGGFFSATGAGFSVGGNQWNAIPDVGLLEGRARPLAAWSGQEFLIWGGYGVGGYLGSGAIYRPTTQQWRVMNPTNAPGARDRAVGVWTGSRFLVWGGRSGSGALGDGSTYNPLSDTWTALTLTNPPAPRFLASGVATSDRIFVWGGVVPSQPGVGTGSQLMLDSNGIPQAWSPMSTVGAPSARSEFVAVWTGKKFLVWGGKNVSGTPFGDGAAYDPASDNWTPLSSTNAPAARYAAAAVWTGVELVIFGGSSAVTELADGAAYDPAKDRWRPLTNGGNPLARTGGAAVWTGAELLIFGGSAAGSPVSGFQRVNPQPPWTLYRKP
jgi:hypothetical protein